MHMTIFKNLIHHRNQNAHIKTNKIANTMKHEIRCASLTDAMARQSHRLRCQSSSKFDMAQQTSELTSLI